MSYSKYIRQSATEILGETPKAAMRSTERLRASQIDNLSTLGSGAIGVLLRSNYLVNWDDQALSELQHLAQLRSAGKARVHASFPELFEGEEGEGVIEAFEELPVYDEILPLEALTEGVEYLPGIMPLLITAPHGGNKKRLKDYELPYDAVANARDGATAEIARDVRASTDNQLPTIIDLVHRQYRTPETRAYFETQIFLHIAEIRRSLDSHHPLLHLDLHGFKPTEKTDAYDLILGTGHRTTTNGLDADNELADYLHKLGYTVYLPNEIPGANEFYMATHKSTLVQRIASLALKNTGSVQIEINAAFRTLEHKRDGEQLARDLGAFCLDWANA